jgi:hypothetical protein
MLVGIYQYPICGHWFMDPDPEPDPTLFGTGFQDAKKLGFFLKILFAYFLLYVHLH